MPDARAIGDDLAERGVALSLGGQVYDPADPMGKMFFNIPATFAEFEVDLLRMRTREGMAVAKAKGKLRCKRPKLSPKQRAGLRQHASGDYNIPTSPTVLHLDADRVPHPVTRTGRPSTLICDQGLSVQLLPLLPQTPPRVCPPRQRGAAAGHVPVPRRQRDRSAPPLG